MTFKIIRSMLLQDNRLGPKPTQQQQSVQDYPRPHTRSPLDIPEILEKIFSYLSSSHLRIGPSLVCKQWRTLSMRYITNSLLWDSLHTNKTEAIRKEFTDHLKGADVLKCHFRDYVVGGVGNGVGLLVNCIRSLSSEERSRLRSSPTCKSLISPSQMTK
ncbi:hypothetical protein BGZ76_002480 [Entomortierella beljakovae]|nr:hypothetical protein BGZ76_002480 [Entomortierella beljakovae]